MNKYRIYYMFAVFVAMVFHIQLFFVSRFERKMGAEEMFTKVNSIKFNHKKQISKNQTLNVVSF